MIKEYEDSNAFEADAIAATISVYVFGFNNCKVKVAESYPSLNLPLSTVSSIPEDEEEEVEEGEEEEIAKEGEVVGEQAAKEGGTKRMLWRCRCLQ